MQWAAKQELLNGTGACFVAGTEISTEKGHKPIEEIKVGDMVYSQNVETGEKGLKKVVRVFEKETNNLVYISVNEQEIITTLEHPFYNPGKGWVAAKELNEGDTLLLQSGDLVIIEQIRHETLETPLTVYNVEVEDWHTYYVSQSGMLVHNACIINFMKQGAYAKMRNEIGEKGAIAFITAMNIGKTALEAALILWFLTNFSYPRIVATAPTQVQLYRVLWSEVAKWQVKSEFLHDVLVQTTTEIYLKGFRSRWFAVAKTATRPENMQGFHEDNMLFIVDEASGVRDDVMEAILGTLSGKNNKLLLCGNPTRTSGIFYDSHHSRRGEFISHKISSRDSNRTSKENIDSLEKAYGKDSNIVRVRVDGEFPVAEDDVFINLQYIDKAILSGKDWITPEKPALIHIGCDVARFGDDKTVIGYKIDEKADFYSKVRGQDTMKTADKIIELAEHLREKYKFTGKIPVKIDDGGVGGGVVDRLRQIIRNSPDRFGYLTIMPVKFGQRIQNRNYHDSTSYMMGVVKKLLEDGNLFLPDDNNLAGQLSSRKYNITETSKIQVESKEIMKKRGLSSPDEADCLLLLCLPINVKTK